MPSSSSKHTQHLSPIFISLPEDGPNICNVLISHTLLPPSILPCPSQAAPMMAEARNVSPRTARKQAYEAELLPNLSKLPSLKSSPGIYTKKTEMPAFKMTESEGARIETIVRPDGIPTPDPAKPAAVNAPSSPSVMAAPPVSDPTAPKASISAN